MKTINFFKQNHKWYADIPNHSLEDNEMVFGSDQLLDLFANNKETVSLTLSDDLEAGDPIITLTRKDHDEDGAFYSVESSIFVDILEIWICNVTHDVFGEHPEKIYIYKIE